MSDYPKYTKEQLSIFDFLPSGVLINVDDGNGGLRYAYSNPFLAQSLGYRHEEFQRLLTDSCFAAIYEADLSKTKNARAAANSGKIIDSISRQKKKDGSLIWVLTHIRQVELDGQKGLFFLFSQIQDLIGLQNQLTAQNKEWDDILQTVPIGLLVYREENGVRTTLSINRLLLEFANAVGSQLDSRHRAWTEAEMGMILNQDIYAFCENDDIPLVAGMIEESEHKPVSDCVFRLRGSAGLKPVYIYASCASKKSEGGGRTYYVTYQNVTENENRRLELVEKQDQLYHTSYFDSLTGVKNRNAYNEFVTLCKHNRIYNVGFAFCDINGLKQTNDTLGHYYGDKMIRRFVSILREFFDSNQIYRISGDEFVIVSPGVEQESFKKTMQALDKRIQEEENLASIGAFWKESVSDILRRTTQAEQIMYVEKQRYYEATRTINSKHRPHILEALLDDFDRGRYIMYLQPKTSIDGKKVIGAEALARKCDTDGSIILPYSFVPQLEHELLIPKLDFYMLDQTCRFLQELHQAGNDSFSVSVNVSRVTIVENEFMDTVLSVLEKYDFVRSNLELELTESNKTLDADKLSEYLIQLKELGVKISLDDMGTDYSSLTLLTLEGFDWVKIDRSLIIQLGQKKAEILVRHIIGTCHDLGLKVIAEGVETDEIRALLKEMNCDAYQGYLKSKPIPVGEFKEKFL